MSNDLYRDRSARLDTVVGEDKVYWTMLHRIADNLDCAHLPKDNFIAWCEENHGFRPIYDADDGITSKPDIRDPQKYMICLLKYGG